MSPFARLSALFLLAVAARGLVAALTAIPGRDAAHYLWMAEQAAEGRLGALFGTVFHPGYSMLVAAALWLFPDADVFRVGQTVAWATAALAIVPLHAVAQRLFDERTAWLTALFYAVGAWFCRHPADALSEGPFYLCVALYAERLTARLSSTNAVLAGLAAGLAFACRPEALALIAVGCAYLAWNRRRGDALAALLGSFVLVLPLVVGWSNDGFTLTPKAAFNYEVGVGMHGAGLPHYLRELRDLPGVALDDLGFGILPLALYGVVRCRPWRLRSPLAILFWPLVLQCAVIPMLRAHYRFVSGFGVLWLVFAAVGAWQLARLLAKQRWVWFTGLAVVLAAEVVRLPHMRRQDRIVLRELGAHLRPLLGPGDRLATDMPRLSFFAGLEPPPPRPIAPTEIEAAARLTRTRFVAVVFPRTPIHLPLVGYHQMSLPPPLQRLLDRRRVRVFERD